MTTNTEQGQHRLVLKKIAQRLMLAKGLVPDFSKQALAELDRVHGAATQQEPATRDQRNLLWCSIDNDDSRDLDQLTVAEALPEGAVKILVAIADVDAIVKKQSALDVQAQQNTTSVYTVAQIFSMLPEKLSTDLTSLNLDADRLAIVVELVLTAEGTLRQSDVYSANVRNRAKLAYNSVASWLDGQGPMPAGIGTVQGLEANIRLQDSIAQKLKAVRHEKGALDLETIETRPVFAGEIIQDLKTEQPNRAKDLIANFMIAANGVVAGFLESHHCPAIRRIVRKPKRWDRIVEIAAEQGTKLPPDPNAKALEDFLTAARVKDPLRFPDLSLSVIKLLGRGEYVPQVSGGTSTGHFGLALEQYAHSTAPNRRYPDLITQRLLKAVFAGRPIPYSNEELTALAARCTEKEDAANKVERQVRKCAAALLLESRLGEQFDAIVTGVNSDGTWVRIFHPPVEGRLESGSEGIDVGHRLRVKLVHTDSNQGFIDFKRVP